MPRTRTVTSTKKRKGAGGTKRQPQQQRQKQHTAKELFEAAEHAMTSQDATQAIALYDAALNVPIDKADMDTTLLLEKRGEAKVSLSDPDGARLDFERALQVVREQQHRPSNDSNGEMSQVDPSSLERMASLLMYMGQLSGELEAVAAYTEGIQLLEQSLQIREHQQQQIQLPETTATGPATQTALEETRKQLAAACCSAAEVYLTDLCYEGNAEEKCESLVQRALQVSDQPKSLDALQTAASLRLSQCRGMEAVDFMQQCFAQIKAPCEALCRLVGIRASSAQTQPNEQEFQDDGGAADQALELTELEVEQQQTMPGFEFRCQTAKLLLECSAVLRKELGDGDMNKTIAATSSNIAAAAGTEQPFSAQDCAEAAVTVLGSLLAENDEVIESWYLMGDAFAALEDTEMARYYYERTIQMLQHVQQELQEQQEQLASEDEEDEEEEMLQNQLDEIECQHEDVQQKLNQLPPAVNEGTTECVGAEPMDQDT
ncbi:hypothetical protein ACA910_001647 [Epithemia clementina (nom. ined.)]